jgi:hypothetical protein
MNGQLRIDNGQLRMRRRTKPAHAFMPNSELEGQASRINVVEVLRIRRRLSARKALQLPKQLQSLTALAPLAKDTKMRRDFFCQ